MPQSIESGDVSAPWTVADLDPAWVTAALRAAGAVGEDTTVSDLEVSDLFGSFGISGLLYRLTPRYRGGSGPAGLVLKLPSDVPANRAVGDLARLYEREAAFYLGPARRLAARVPRPYAAVVDPATGSSVLLLEELAGWTAHDQVAGADAALAARVVDALAAMHAGEWERAPDPHEPSLPGFEDPVSTVVAELYRSCWLGFVDAFGSLLPSAALAVGARIGEAMVEVMVTTTARAPRTLLHGDCRLGNMLFDDRDPAPADSGPGAVALLDWQAAARGPAMSDLATFLGQSLPVAVRRAHERDLVARWHTRMVERIGAAMNAYPLEQAFAHYRRLLLYSAMFPVLVGGAMDLRDDYGRSLGEALTVRAFTALLDLDCADLLP